MKTIKSRGTICLCVLSIVLMSTASAFAQKMTVKELVSKHLESIGSKEKLAAIKSQMAMGTSEFESKLPKKTTNGKAIVASRGGEYMFLISLNSQEYPFEKIGLFSNTVTLPWVTPGARSPLGAFISEHDRMVSDGIFTGVISTVWSLLDPELNGAQTKIAGKKKVDERDAYVLEYYPKGVNSTEFTVRLFFDTETYRHLRTESKHVINPSQDTFGTLGRQAGLRQTLIESFTDFKTVDGLTLPYSYDVHYTTESNSGTYEFFWRLRLQQYLLNPNLDANFFTFETGAAKPVQ